MHRVYFCHRTVFVSFRFICRAAFASVYEFSLLVAWLVSKTEYKIQQARFSQKLSNIDLSLMVAMPFTVNPCQSLFISTGLWMPRYSDRLVTSWGKSFLCFPAGIVRSDWLISFLELEKGKILVLYMCIYLKTRQSFIRAKDTFWLTNTTARACQMIFERNTAILKFKIDELLNSVVMGCSGD